MTNTQKLEILLIDDLDLDIQEIKSELTDTMYGEFNLTHMSQLQGSLDLLENKKLKFDVILLDLGLINERKPQEIFEAVDALSKDIPIIVITGKNEEDLALFVVNCGAADNMTRGNFATTYGKLRDAIRFSLVRSAKLSHARVRGDNATDLKNQLIGYISGEYSHISQSEKED